MLFNSVEFLFIFLPIVLGLFLFLKNRNAGRAELVLIAMASLAFYAWWDARYLALLVGSILFNFYVGSKLAEKGQSKSLLWIGVGGNLLCLAWFKYANFFVDNANRLLTDDLVIPQIILPLGISFFTFLQIAYIVDAYKGQAGKHSFIEYLSFVTFFPHLIAGPILNHKTIMPQFHALPHAAYNWERASMGLSLLAIGLFKKVIIADELSIYASPVFDAADAGHLLSAEQAWSGVLSYTMQLYFDFSAYTDMAIGLGLMFMIRLPTNFLSPYKATSIIEFWQRWHITLSNFLKEYLYIPLGGNRKGQIRRYSNLMITMLLGGLWHGAGWTFIIWGGLHGLYLCINHLWRKIVTFNTGVIGRVVGWGLTMSAVIFAWIFFRAHSVDGAVSLIKSLGGLQNKNYDLIILEGAFEIIVVSVAMALLLPNTMQIIAHAEQAGPLKWYSWAPNKRWMAMTIVLLLVALYTIVYTSNRISEFIYFQF